MCDLVPLATPYEPTRDYTGWLMSEKLDGVRALWTGSELVTRNGNRINAPGWFTERLPKGFRLDGELWIGRGRFEETASIVRRGEPDDRWLEVDYRVFDAPDARGDLMDRLTEATPRTGTGRCVIERHKPILNRAHVESEFARVLGWGGEGLILRDPNAPWTPGRSYGWVKMKPHDETDATVIGHTNGKASVEVDERGLRYRVTMGEPAPVGSVIRVGHNGRTRRGVPRFPRCVGIRAEQEVMQ